MKVKGVVPLILSSATILVGCSVTGDEAGGKADRIIAYIDWDAQTISIVSDYRQAVAEEWGIGDPSAATWELEHWDGNTVAVNVVETPSGKGFPEVVSRNASATLKGRCTDIRAGEECDKVGNPLAPGSIKTKWDAYRGCKGETGTCKADWKKVGKIHFYPLFYMCKIWR